MTTRTPKGQVPAQPYIPSSLNTFIPMDLTKRTGRSSIVLPEGAPQKTEPREPLRDNTLINGLAKAFYWQRLIDLGVVRSGKEIAEREGLDQGTVNECMRLTLLDPILIQAILEGIHPQGLTLNWLTRNPIPLLWSEQHELFRSIAAGPSSGGRSRSSA